MYWVCSSKLLIWVSKLQKKSSINVGQHSSNEHVFLRELCTFGQTEMYLFQLITGPRLMRVLAFISKESVEWG